MSFISNSQVNERGFRIYWQGKYHFALGNDTGPVSQNYLRTTICLNSIFVIKSVLAVNKTFISYDDHKIV